MDIKYSHLLLNPLTVKGRQRRDVLRRVAFRSDRSGNQDLWRLERESREFEPIDTHPAEEAWGAWSPD